MLLTLFCRAISSDLTGKIPKEKTKKGKEVWAVNVMVQTILAIATAQQTIQHYFLMHSIRRGPAIEPGLEDLHSVRCAQGLYCGNGLVNGLKVYRVGGEEFAASFNHYDFELGLLTVWENLFH